MPAAPPDPTPTKAPIVSPQPTVGKPIVKSYPTPNLDDYIVTVRRDSRKQPQPEKGVVFPGVDQQKKLRKGFVFAKSVPVEQLPGFVDDYYLRPFRAQETYNATVDYPYVDRNYPRYTRTYILLRTDSITANELQADAVDPVRDDLLLTDHKIQRLEQDQVLDAIFVQVIRVFERLPGPIIKSYGRNRYAQLTTNRAQDVVASPPPTLSALIEEASQERSGTAKAKNTIVSVSSVFPATVLKEELPNFFREEFQASFTTDSISQRQAGQAQQPTISTGEFNKSETQENEFVKVVEIQSQALPQQRNNKILTNEFGGGVLADTIKADVPTSNLDQIEGGYLITDAQFRDLGAFGKLQFVKSLADADAWPVMVGLKTLDEGIYAGIRIDYTKQFAPAALPPPANPPRPGGFTDLDPHDKWRTIQITSRLDLTSLPAPFTYATLVHVELPPTLLSVFGVYGDRGGTTQISNDSSELATVIVESGPLGSIGHTLTHPFRGAVAALVTTSFSPTPPTLAQIPVPGKITLAQGSATLHSVYSKFTQTRGQNLNEDANDGQIRVETVSITPALTGGVILSGLTFQGAPNAAFAETSDGQFVAQLFQPGNQATLNVTIPLSSPGQFVSGQRFLWDGNVSKWRFGVFVIESVTIIIP